MFRVPGIGVPVVCPRCGQPHCGRWEIHKGQREYYCTTTWRTISPTLLNEQAQRLGLPLRPPPSLSRSRGTNVP